MLLFVRRMLLCLYPDPKGDNGGDPKPEEKKESMWRKAYENINNM